MDPQIYAFLGRWHDIAVGRDGRGFGRGWGRRRWGGYGGDGYGDNDAYGGGGGGGPDPTALMAQYQQLLQYQQQLIQQQMAAQMAAQQGQMAAPPPPAPPAPAHTAGWYDLAAGVGAGPPNGAPFPPWQPRAAVVDAPLPTQANRDILPMSTGVPILPTQSAQITGRPQTLVYKIGRFVISNAGTAGGAADWIVNDFKIGNRSQFVQSGDVPGDLFATNAIDTFVRFESAQTAMDVVVVVTYIGLNESGCPFFGACVGTAAV
jgi:hypothetical protein